MNDAFAVCQLVNIRLHLSSKKLIGEFVMNAKSNYRVSKYRLASKDALVRNGYTCHTKIS